VQITGVRIESAETGLQVVLETVEGELAAPTTETVGNALIIEIPNAVLALPEEEGFEQFEPAEGIAFVSVTGLPDNRVQVSITGTDALPEVQVRTEAGNLLLSVVPGTVRGDDADEAINDETIEVVVTGEQETGYYVPNTSVGTRTDTPLRDIPQSIQVVPQQVLRDQNITRLDEVIRNVPGATPSESSSQIFGSFTSRGFNVSAFNNSNYLRNGLRDPAGSFLIDFTGVDRLEFLRGPASVLYGVGSPGGRINLVTKQPLRDPFYAIDVTIGNFDFYRGAIDLSGPLNNSRTILYRLNASYLNRNNFIDFFEQRGPSVSPTVNFALGERTRLILEGDYSNRNGTFLRGLPAVGTVLSNPNGDIPRNRNIGEPDDSHERTTGRVGYRFEHQFSDNWSFRNAFGATFYESSLDALFSESFDADDRTLNRFRIRSGESVDAYSLTAEVIGRFLTGSIEHQLVLGTALSRFNYLSFGGTASASSLDLFNPVYGQPRETVPTTFDSGLLSDTLGIYVQDQVALTENLRLVLGGQFDLFRQTDNDFLSDTETSQSGNAFSPFIGIVYQPVEPISLYASYARSFTPTIGRAFDGSQFAPERGTQYEVGVKADLNDQLSATLALYNLTRTNVLTDDNTPGVPPGFSIQTGEQRSRGIELNITGEILPGWNIIAGYAYTDARITEDNTLSVGNRLNNVPENAFNLWTTYEFQSGDLQGLGFGLGLFYVGEREGDLGNTFQLPSYLRTDAAIYYQRNRFRASLNFKNLFDIGYFEAAEDDLNVFYGEPFTVQGTVSWQF
jgi:iron complex outermembrane receptor protein